MTHTLTVKQNFLTSRAFKLQEKAASWYEAALKRSQRKQMYKRIVCELSKMSDRDLDDIGVNRYDIPFIAAEASEEK